MSRCKINFARKLRKNMTDAERILWSKLRNKQIANIRFRKQAPIGDYIVDFLAHDIKLSLNSMEDNTMRKIKLYMTTIERFG